MGPVWYQSSSLEVEGLGLRRPSGRFFLGQPFSPPTFNNAGSVAVVFVGLEDRGNPASEVGRQGPPLAAGERGAETGVGDQVGQLEAGNIIGLGFDLELAAGEASVELVRRHEVGALLEDSLEGVFEPAVLLSMAARRNASRAMPLNGVSRNCRTSTGWGFVSKRAMKLIACWFCFAQKQIFRPPMRSECSSRSNR